MPFFLVKVADEVAAGDIQAALSTLTSGAPAEIKTIEDDLVAGFEAAAAVFAPAEVKTVLNSLVTTVQNGIKAGVASLTSGTVTNAESAGTAGVDAVQAAIGQSGA